MNLLRPQKKSKKGHVLGDRYVPLASGGYREIKSKDVRMAGKVLGDYSHAVRNKNALTKIQHDEKRKQLKHQQTANQVKALRDKRAREAEEQRNRMSEYNRRKGLSLPPQILSKSYLRRPNPPPARPRPPPIGPRPNRNTQHAVLIVIRVVRLATCY